MSRKLDFLFVFPLQDQTAKDFAAPPLNPRLAFSAIIGDALQHMPSSVILEIYIYIIHMIVAVIIKAPRCVLAL